MTTERRLLTETRKKGNHEESDEEKFNITNNSMHGTSYASFWTIVFAV